jgi:thiol-disulfide isomerase/thioredoxin
LIAGSPSRHLTLYGRAYCHLCDDMLHALVELQAEHRFTLDVIDVDTDPALAERYDELVPVLIHEGREVCHHFLNRDTLIALVGTPPIC